MMLLTCWGEIVDQRLLNQFEKLLFSVILISKELDSQQANNLESIIP